MSNYKSITNIPLEFLRRSSRISNSVKNDVPSNFKRPTMDKSYVETSRTRKRIKKELVVTETVKEEVPKIKYEVFPEATSRLIDEQRFNDIRIEPEGILEVDDEELDLERTLMGGQSFRWVKEDMLNGKPLFTGVVDNHAFQLWRISKDKIGFRSLNKESQKSKISARSDILKDYFQLDYNLKTLYKEWSSKDKHLGDCCLDYRGFRILRQDPVENVFSFICATNNNIKRISQMIDKLCKRYGTILESTSSERQSVYDSYQSFPPVERLAEDDVFQCLRYELGFGYRAKFINETAKQILKFSQASKHNSARDYLLSLRKLQYKETCKELMKFPGIGRKVADCICLMSMDHLNSVPIDCHIYEIVCRDYMPDLRQKHKTLTENVHDMIGNFFTTLHGPLAGWSTSVLFIAELKHLKVKDSNENAGKNRGKSKEELK